MESVFSDFNTIINRNPMNSIILKKVLMRWKQHEFITKAEYKKLISLNLILPPAYGCLKIHKIGNLLHIIISLIGNPLHNLASYLHKIFNDSLPQTISW